MENFAQLSEKSNLRLDQLEAKWLQGQIPDVASYLQESLTDDPQTWRDLVELDLEYRWRRFQPGTSENELDPFGFPLYPRLEHYVDLLAEPLRPNLLIPDLLAEEYRVRTFWGDRPDKQLFLDRLPEDSKLIESALEHVEVEFEIEGMSTSRGNMSSEESTQLFDQRSAVLESTPGSSEVRERIGKYLLQELLGRGGFGEVWKAFDPDLNRYVALKFPHSGQAGSTEHYRNLRREAEKMAALEGVQGIVPVYEVGEFQGLPYIVSSLIDGEDLSSRQKHSPLSFADAARIVADVAETLHRAHLQDLFHRDVKLSNILIDRQDRVFLSDFGLCVSEQDQLHEGHSATGTYAYMAPEQVSGHSHRVDGRTDIYSLGVVLYRLLSGRLPFIGTTSAEYMQQTLQKAPRPLRSINDQIPEELERVCLKCLSKNIQDRYATAGDLARDLHNWLSSLEQVDVPAVAAAPPASTSFSEQHPLVMMLAMLLISIGGMYLISQDRFHPEAEQQLQLAAAGSNRSPQLPQPDRNGPGEIELINQLPPVQLNQSELLLADASPGALLEPRKESWKIVTNGKALEAKSHLNGGHFALQSLGRLEKGKSVEIQIDLKEMVPGSSGGIFFGMSEPLFRSSDAYWKAILIECYLDGRYRLLRQYERYESEVRHNSSDLDFDLPIDKSVKDFVLLIEVSSEGLERMEINGKGYPELVKRFRETFPDDLKNSFNVPNPHLEGTGRYGLSCQWGNVFFANPVINGKACRFKKVQ